MSNKKGYSTIEGCIRQSSDLPLNKWTLQTKKNGTEIWVECEDYSIFVGEGYTQKSKAISLGFAHVIVKALNDYERAYDTHDKGTNSHLDGH